MERILFYPTIDIPQGTWLKSALLYWDEILTIAPHSAYYEPKIYGKKVITDLIDYELVRPHMPNFELIDNEEFENGFLNFIDRKFSKSQQNKIRRMVKNDDMRGKGKYKPFTLLDQKMNRLGESLEWRGLIKRLDADWFLAPEIIAKPFMAYLASIMASQGNAIPCSNSPKHLTHFLSVNEIDPQDSLIHQDYFSFN